MTRMICGICQKEISSKDNYCRLTDYYQGKFVGENFYHTLCYVDKLKNSITMNKEKLRGKLIDFIKKKKEQMQYVS